MALPQDQEPADAKPAGIRLRLLVDPFNDELSAYHCDMRFGEADLQHVDDSHGLDDFIERFIRPALWALLDQFQQPYTDAEDLMRKTIDANRSALPRSIEFYRQKMEMDKQKGDARIF